MRDPIQMRFKCVRCGLLERDARSTGDLAYMGWRNSTKGHICPECVPHYNDVSWRDPDSRLWDNAIQVEHLVRPGPAILRETGSHLVTCNCKCSQAKTCPRCGEVAHPSSIAGRWDAEKQRTALPFEAVWTMLSCGCEFGDYILSRPEETLDKTNP